MPLFLEPIEEYIAPKPKPDFRRLDEVSNEPIHITRTGASLDFKEEGPANLPSFLVARDGNYLSLDEVIPPEPERVRVGLNVARKLIERAQAKNIRVRDVLRDVLGLDSAMSEEVIFELPLSDNDYRQLAMRYKLRPDHRDEIRIRLDDPMQAKAVADRIAADTGLKTVSWQEANEDLMSAFVIRNIIMYTVVGAILLVAMKEKKLRIEVGYGWEGALPDVEAKRIIREVITPFFKKAQFAQGIDAGIDKIQLAVAKENKAESTAVNDKGQWTQSHNATATDATVESLMGMAPVLLGVLAVLSLLLPSLIVGGIAAAGTFFFTSSAPAAGVAGFVGFVLAGLYYVLRKGVMKIE